MESNGRVVQEREEGSDASRALSASPARIKLDGKVTRIRDACRWKDIETLRKLATSEGGLVSDEIRRQACSCP